jgi:hypothetical protein
MKKNYSLIFVMLSCLVVSAKDSSWDSFRYQWKVSHRYTYQSQAENSAFNIVFDVMGHVGNEYNILVSEPSGSPDHSMLLKVDDKGVVKHRYYRGSVNIYDGSLGAVQRLNAILNLKNFCKSEVLELPPASLMKNKIFDYQGRRYSLKDFSSFTNDDSFCIETRDLLREQESSASRISRVFDLKRGVLQEYHQGDERTGFGFKLGSSILMNHDLFSKKITECDDALDEDEFRLRVCLPYLSDNSNLVKRGGVLGLLEIQDTKLAPRVYFELSKALGTNAVLSGMVDSYLFKHLEKGAEWALAVILEEDWAQLNEYRMELRLSRMVQLTGLKADENPEKWKSWLKMVQKRLPRLRECTVRDLIDATNSNNEPWVRVFAVKELCERPEVDVAQILDSAKVNESKEVRDFASYKLKQRQGTNRKQ